MIKWVKGDNYHHHSADKRFYIAISSVCGEIVFQLFDNSILVGTFKDQKEIVKKAEELCKK